MVSVEELLPARVHPRGGSSTIPMGGLERGRAGESCFGGGDVAQNVAAQCVGVCVHLEEAQCFVATVRLCPRLASCLPGGESER